MICYDPCTLGPAWASRNIKHMKIYHASRTAFHTPGDMGIVLSLVIWGSSYAIVISESSSSLPYLGDTLSLGTICNCSSQLSLITRGKGWLMGI